MNRILLKSKIHRAVLTGIEPDYEGSITIDRDLLEEADIFPHEQVHVLNFNNGNRFITYVIPATRGSGAVVLNGPAARLGVVGDHVIVLSYCELTDAERPKGNPKIVYLDQDNHPAENFAG